MSTGVEGGEYQVQFLRSETEWDDVAFRESWSEFLDVSDNVNRIYSSPGWFDGLRMAESSSDLAIQVIRDKSGSIVCITPVMRTTFNLSFYAGRRPFLKIPRRCVHVLGSKPLSFQMTNSLAESLVESLLTAWDDVEAIYFDVVAVGSAWSWHLESSTRNLILHRASRPRPWHLLDFRSTEGKPSSKRSSRTLATLRRKTRRLAEEFGDIEVCCVSTESEVEQFLESAEKIRVESWQGKVLGHTISRDPGNIARFKKNARDGLLRCYYMSVGNMPCAFVFGFTYAKVYHSSSLGFDPKFGRCSPGDILWLRIFDDIETQDDIDLINFGPGDAEYKRRFGNVTREDESILLLKGGLVNRLVVAGHRLFSAAKELVKNAFGRRNNKPSIRPG